MLHVRSNNSKRLVFILHRAIERCNECCGHALRWRANAKKHNNINNNNSNSSTAPRMINQSRKMALQNANKIKGHKSIIIGYSQNNLNSIHSNQHALRWAVVAFSSRTNYWMDFFFAREQTDNNITRIRKILIQFCFDVNFIL